MNTTLEGKLVAILATDGFEESELIGPRSALEAAGAKTVIVSPDASTITGWNESDWGREVNVDVLLESAKPAEYDALLIPGGVKNPDTLRMNETAVEFVRHFVQSGKPIGAICHGPWLLIEARGVEGRTITSYPSIRTDITNARGIWVDKEVVVDQGIVTSRSPGDIPAFCKKLIEEIGEGIHLERAESELALM